ncbi:MAG: elongator complex protein 3 [Thermoplasmata archaeon]
MAPALRVSAVPGPMGPEEIHRIKLERVRASGARTLPSNVDWLASLPAQERARFDGAIRRRPSRTLSGVAVVAVMTAPARCPHGRCTYCPGGVENNSPQSYTGEEPSALRGAQFHWDSRRITAERLASLEETGHPTSKVEVIVMGGTFPSRPVSYQEGVLRGVYEGLNGAPAGSLVEAQLANESAARRMVGLTVETRPDWCDARVLPFLLGAGVTRIEIGVECLHEEVLRAVGRAHGVEDVTRATTAARGQGLKICYHLMIGLPGMTPEEDVRDALRVLGEPALRPDMLKIYPTLVIPGTPLYDGWKAGRYVPYDAPTAVEVLARIKRALPPWVRIQRIQRDIPARLIADGVRVSNLRERALARLAESGAHCRCLRCREVGRRARPPIEDLALTETQYPTLGGTELFIAWEDPRSDSIAGFLRLRLPSESLEGALPDPVIRELKVLGTEVAVGTPGAGRSDYQHRGLGRALLERAEERAREAGHRGLYVTSAVGTRPYYRVQGYVPVGSHMRKALFAGRKP